jgi:hypothetical protein
MPKERKQKERRLLEKVREDHNGGFARALASNDWATRERGLQALTLWLSGHRDVQEADLMRLWKALFYCFWHSDKVPVQACSRSAFISSPPPLSLFPPPLSPPDLFLIFGICRPPSRTD